MSRDGMLQPARGWAVVLASASVAVCASVAVVTLAAAGWVDTVGDRASAAAHPIAPRAAAARVVATTTLPPNPDPTAPGVPVPSGAQESDPFLTTAGDRYLLYTSGVPGLHPINVPVATSPDFTTWSTPVDALPTLPGWAVPGFTWAPDVHRFGARYALYFTALVGGVFPATECIGSSFSASPTGPFVPVPVPFICQLDQGGSIDPRVFVDAQGHPWMLWKSDQNIGGATTPTKLWSQPLSPDGSGLTGNPSFLMGPDRPWQGTVVEAPDMVEVDGTYWVVYSANWYNQPAYAIGAARCVGPAGPCADGTPGPLLASNTQGQGPGEPSLFRDASGIWLLYSASRSLAPKPDWLRPVFVTRLGVLPSGPYLAAGGPPSAVDLLGMPVWAPQPWPET